MSDHAESPPVRRVAVVVVDEAHRRDAEVGLTGAGMVLEDLPTGHRPDGAVADGLVDTLVDRVPDVVVLGSDLGEHLIPIVAALVDRAPAIRLLAVVRVGDEPLIDRAVVAGVASVVPAGADGAALAEAVERTARGEAPLTAAAAAAVLRGYRTLHQEPDRLLVDAPALTPTELEVLRRLATGATPDQVAELHQVTPRMVLVSSASAVAKLQRAHLDDARARRRR